MIIFHFNFILIYWFYSINTYVYKNTNSRLWNSLKPFQHFIENILLVQKQFSIVRFTDIPLYYQTDKSIEKAVWWSAFLRL